MAGKIDRDELKLAMMIQEVEARGLKAITGSQFQFMSGEVSDRIPRDCSSLEGVCALGAAKLAGIRIHRQQPLIAGNDHYGCADWVDKYVNSVNYTVGQAFYDACHE
jgi:hypothetical protein